ncbi:MAG: hypothetical protein E6R04_01325 [Spirochaetes bacterium]|nr:MAG: hypothetical protein E6R04_01325 [Spirochaetota bacterium]
MMSKKITVEQANHFLHASGLVLISREHLQAIGELAERSGFYNELKALGVMYHEGFDTVEVDDPNQTEG